MDSHDDDVSIAKYFSGQSIFITGGTGLMGKVLIEKILRSCPGVENVYVLIRPKKNVAIEERWSKITELPLFERLKTERPDALKKVVLIPGDIAEEDFLLSEAHRQLLKEKVTLVYHVAAMIQFSDSITDALNQNLKATWTVLELGKNMAKLQAFVHVSTAYSNAHRPPEEATEYILPACQDWRVMLKMYETERSQLELLKEKLLCGHPNPYTFSKSLAEQVVNEYRKYFPVIIMRPAIVCSSLKEPIPGWIDAANACSAFMIGCAYGLLRVAPSSPDCFLDFIPVDYAIKAFLIAPWKLHLSQECHDKDEKNTQETTEVYNCASANNFPITYSDVEKYGVETIEKWPSENQIWVKSISFVRNMTLYNIMFFINQVLPAMAVDLILCIFGRKTIAIKLTKRVANMVRLVGRLSNSCIAFPNEKFLKLSDNMSEEEKETFWFPQIETHSKKDVIYSQAHGFRKYFLKEDLSELAIERNRKRVARIKLLHKVVTWIAYAAAASFVFWCVRKYC